MKSSLEEIILTSIDNIEKKILETSSKDDRIIRGIWGIDCLFNPINNGRIFSYKFLISQTVGQGCAYSTNYEYPIDFLRQYIGCDFRDCNITDAALKVSVMDSLYGILYPAKNKKQLVINADSFTKMKWRTQIIYDEAQRLLGDKKDKLIVNVGVVGDILHKFEDEGFSVIGTDFDPSIIGGDSFGKIPIIDGNETIDVIAKADLAVITGMTIATNTIDDILECCEKNNVKSIVFAETGANLASYYIDHGVDVYLSELFPFYIFNGTSEIEICYS